VNHQLIEVPKRAGLKVDDIELEQCARRLVKGSGGKVRIGSGITWSRAGVYSVVKVDSGGRQSRKQSREGQQSPHIQTPLCEAIDSSRTRENTDTR
jgi:hypothetical protein